MLKKSRKIFVFLLVGILALGFALSGQTSTSDNVSGWAWSENIGWIGCP